MNLGVENSISLLLFALLEHKILIHSMRPDEVTIIAETLITVRINPSSTWSLIIAEMY